MDSFRLVICARVDCSQMFFLCRRCDRGDRYCSRSCARRGRLDALRAAGRCYQDSRRGRLRHAARQARYRAHATLSQKVTHQTSQPPPQIGIVAASSSDAPPLFGDGKEEPIDAESVCRSEPVSVLRCARCGRLGSFVRRQTLAHLRPLSRPRRW